MSSSAAQEYATILNEMESDDEGIFNLLALNILN